MSAVEIGAWSDRSFSTQMAAPVAKTVCGIDLGTTYSCVGVFKQGTVEIIANDQGNRTTPSYVAFTDTERLVGDGAKNQASANCSNTIFDAKRLIGRKFNDPTVQSDMKLWPFKVQDSDGRPQIVVQFKGETKAFWPEEISAMVTGLPEKDHRRLLASNFRWGGHYGSSLLQRQSAPIHQRRRSHCRLERVAHHQ